MDEMAQALTEERFFILLERIAIAQESINDRLVELNINIATQGKDQEGNSLDGDTRQAIFDINQPRKYSYMPSVEPEIANIDELINVLPVEGQDFIVEEVGDPNE